MLGRQVLVPLGLCASLMTATELGAQAVRGRLLDADSGEPVAGALILLVDTRGAEVASAVISAR